LSRGAAFILRNDGIITLQQLMTNGYDRTVWARQMRELHFSCFGNRQSFHPATNGAYVDRGTATNVAKANFFSAKKNSITARCLHHKTLTDSILRRCCSGAIRQKSLQFCTSMPETSNMFRLKSHNNIGNCSRKVGHYFLGNLPILVLDLWTDCKAVRIF
jgi:hypothetical protein